MSKLSDKQKFFCKEYLIDLNATQACIRAGYSPKAAKEQGYRLLTKTHIQLEVQRLQAKREKRVEITQDMVIDELAKLAFSDMSNYSSWRELEYSTVPGVKDPITGVKDPITGEIEERTIVSGGVRMVPSEELTPAQTAAVSEVSMTTTLQGATTKIKLHDKKGSLELLGKHLGIFNDKHEITGDIKISFDLIGSGEEPGGD